MFTMFSKVLACENRYIQFVILRTIKRKCLSPLVPGFGLCFPEKKINFIKFNFFSSYEYPPKDVSSESSENGTDSEDKIRLQKWIDFIKHEGGRVPNKISEEHFLELLSLPNETSKRRRLEFFFKRECAKFNNSARKERRKELKRQKWEESNKIPKGHIEYGVWKNSMFAKINRSHVKNILNNRLANAMKFNQPLVIDMDFYDHMERREVSSLSKQLSFSIIDNRSHSEPFNLTMCNVNFDCKKFQSFVKFMPSILKPSFPMNITSKSYLDIFPNEKLVYLSPHARDEMMEFDHEAIYIIGGFVNLRSSTPVTQAKAQKENIKAMKLPLDRYHIFKGKKELGVPVVVNILLDLRDTGDWKKAFENIPKRLIQK